MKSQIGSKLTASKSVSTKEYRASKPPVLKIIELDVSKEPLQLVPSTFIKVDHSVLFDNIAIVSGWMSASAEIHFENVLQLLTMDRPDADAAVDGHTFGFIAVISMPTAKQAIGCVFSMEEHRFSLSVRFASNAEDVVSSMQYFAMFSKDLMENYVKSRLFSEYLAKNCSDLPQQMRANKKNAHLDIVKSFPGFGYVAYGWAISRSKANFWLVSSDGKWHALSQGVRFNRPDVMDAFVDSFGTHASEAGFFCVVPHSAIQDDSLVRLVVVTEEGLFVVHQMTASRGPQTPLSYAKWAFSLSTPASRFFNRLESSEGALIDHLIKAHRDGYPTDIEVWDAGAPLASPEVSIIVPLYGRSDFVEYQLTHFAADPDFRKGKTELIYVIDDPAMVEPLRQSYHQLFSLYQIPFRIVWGKINRGYSGANNLGIAVARGATVILLNSDVFPVRTGWVKQMSDKLHSDTSIGAVGARLEYADGSVQHQGMAFIYSRQLGVWLNDHPKRGLDIAPQEVALSIEAATGACLAVRREDLVQLGGMDEGFLIGDFEDSDLCLKLRALRGRIVLLAGTRLVHLERQSFSNLGSSDFRTNIVKFNAWRHHRRWASAIVALKEKVKQ